VPELENAVEHAVALAKNRFLIWEDMPAHMRHTVEHEHMANGASNAFETARQQYDSMTRQLYVEALKAARGEIPKAAHLLGMSRATFYRRVKTYGLQKEVSKLRVEYKY
jgi:DNA-binding NtrC family response regulator